MERLQVEAGITLTRTGLVRETSVGEALVRIPLSDRLELRAGAPSYLRVREDGNSDSGFDNSFLGVKFQILAPDDGKIGFAVLAGATLPTGSRSVAERSGLQPEIKLALAREFTERIGLGVNVGYAREKDSGERFNNIFASASLGISLAERLGSFVEVVVLSKVNATGDNARYVAAGVSYLVNPNLMVDARLGSGVKNDFGSPDNFAGAGLSLRF